MKVVTTRLIQGSRPELWPLLTHSEMTSPARFCLGIPKPVACELPDGRGGVGKERRCHSDRGTVIQRILEWQPPGYLRFEMEDTDHSWGPCLRSIEDSFTLSEHPQGTTIIRTTSYHAHGPFALIKELLFWVGLKRVHLYVFKNWKESIEKKSS